MELWTFRQKGGGRDELQSSWSSFVIVRAVIYCVVGIGLGNVSLFGVNLFMIY